MNLSIIKAVEERVLLRFRYKGSMREAEPHTYGQRPDGTEAVCAWQVSGGSGEDFRLFFERDMSEVSTGSPFGQPRQGYRRGDARFTRVYAEL